MTSVCVFVPPPHPKTLSVPVYYPVGIPKHVHNFSVCQLVRPLNVVSGP